MPIGVGVKPHIFETLFCEFLLILHHSFSTVATTSQLFGALLRPSQFFSSLLTTLLNCSQAVSPLTSTHLFPPLLDISQLMYIYILICLYTYISCTYILYIYIHPIYIYILIYIYIRIYIYIYTHNILSTIMSLLLGV